MITIPEVLFDEIREIRIRESITPKMEYLNISKVCTTAILKELRDNYGFKTE
jgi:hypothetical protein